MNKKIIFIIVWLISLLITSDFVKLVEKVKPTVVRITITREYINKHFSEDNLNKYFDIPTESREYQSFGSGFILSSDGYIMTNNHVIDKSKEIVVKLEDGREFFGKIIGKDPKTDLALIKIEVSNLPTIKLGDSDKVKVGELVIAIGNPFGKDFTVTAGIISATGRQLNMCQFEDFIQTDASINPGNSGGPLINQKGEVIGINAVMLSGGEGSIGLGFAIPADIAKKVYNDLKIHGKVIRGWLGIITQEYSKLEAKFINKKIPGILITKIVENSPAALANLQLFDYIVNVNGKLIKNNKELLKNIVNSSPGDKIKLGFYRGNILIFIEVIIGTCPEV